MLLALDTSTSVASVALVTSAPEPSGASGASGASASEARLLAELTWRVGQRHSTELLERLEWLLAASRARMEDVTGVAVALGPGSFNGVRVALATAKSLAFARGVPLYGAPTLDIIAWGHRAVGGTICAILEAGRGQVYAATYDADDADDADDAGSAGAASWAPCDGYAVLTASELAAQIQGEAFFCGELAPGTRAILAEALGSRFRSAPALEERRASWLAELALARAIHQRYDDPITLEPLYLRRPAITSSARQRLPSPEGAEDSGQREDAPGGEGPSDALRR